MGPVWVRYGTGTGSVRVRYGAGTQNCGPVLEFGPVPQPLRTGSSRRPGSGPKRGLHAADPLRSLVRAGPRCQDAARAPPVLLRVPRRRSFRFRTPRLTGPELHRAQAECSLPADCISQRALRRRAALCRAEGPQSTLGDVVRNGEGGGSSRDGGSPPSGLTGVSRSRCGLLAAVLLQARGVRKGQRLREKLEEGEWASAAVRRLTPARRASAHPDMAAECSGRSERLREI